MEGGVVKIYRSAISKDRIESEPKIRKSFEQLHIKEISVEINLTLEGEFVVFGTSNIDGSTIFATF
jgi:hypothetical protein